MTDADGPEGSSVRTAATRRDAVRDQVRRGWDPGLYVLFGAGLGWVGLLWATFGWMLVFICFLVRFGLVWFWFTSYNRLLGVREGTGDQCLGLVISWVCLFWVDFGVVWFRCGWCDWG